MAWGARDGGDAARGNSSGAPSTALQAPAQAPAESAAADQGGGDVFLIDAPPDGVTGGAAAALDDEVRACMCMALECGPRACDVRKPVYCHLFPPPAVCSPHSRWRCLHAHPGPSQDLGPLPPRWVRYGITGINILTACAAM